MPIQFKILAIASLVSVIMCVALSLFPRMGFIGAIIIGFIFTILITISMEKK